MIDRLIARPFILLLAACAAGACSDRAEPESFLIPDGYVGDVYVIFEVADGAAAESDGGRRIYRIPPTGILRTQVPPTYGRADWSFVYVGPTGDVLVSIPKPPGSTLHDTPQNRANPAVEIHNLQTGMIGAPVPGKPGNFSGDAPCAVKMYRFFVGTRAQYLDEPRTIDIDRHLEQNPVPCPPAD